MWQSDVQMMAFALSSFMSFRDLCQPNNASLFLSPTLDRLTEACVHLENGSTWINDTVLSENRELAAAEYYYDVQQASDEKHMGRDLKDLLRDYGGEPDLIMLTSSLGQQAGTSQVWLAFLLLAGFILDTMIYLFHDGPSLGAAVSAYANSYFNIVLALMLVCAVNVTLDAERLLDALSQQLTVPLRQLRWFWLTCWRLLCPLLLLGMFVSSVWHHATHPLQFRWRAAGRVGGRGGRGAGRGAAAAPPGGGVPGVRRVRQRRRRGAVPDPPSAGSSACLPPNKRDSLSGAGGGNRSGSVGAA
ncbi:hypothetical protein FJT64_018963 [Amphibalanus amphitrite]|uniref:Uncharacterized protein n=1 Tax=Amphibalanus amphitrite TaxID=1232801 RepID=A0A6A4WRV3_AMPAM|nr:hypothetical protein FJT64_018963 [Amphibalanus amphitrite]